MASNALRDDPASLPTPSSCPEVTDGGGAAGHTAMKYRSDIDGLRSIAVMSVILAHAGFTSISGGFLGVDVFFVISGYLITTILRNDLAEGRYTLAGFYERRARRIMPALLVIILVCIPFALWLMLPDFLQNFAQSVVATLFFANNLLLAKTSGYWALESSFKPMLHTWSLGVEEQYYIVFPLFLAAVFRFGTRTQVLGIAAIAAVSFALSENGWRHSPDVSFYLPTTRAWELMAGSLASYVTRRPRSIDPLVSAAALLAIVVPMFVFTESTPSPSFYSAVPVLGTVGVLLFNRTGTLAYRVLSLRPMVFIGLISYSAYLWHQPLFAFARVASLTPPSRTEMLLLIVATLVMATLSWRFIETPLRDRRLMPLRRFVPLVGGATAILVAFGLIVHFKQGFPQWTYPNIGSSGDVYISYNEGIGRYRATAFPRNGRTNIALIGDSYARDIGNVLVEGGANKGKNLIYLDGYPACHSTAIYPAHAPAVLADADMVVLAIDQHDTIDVPSLEAARAEATTCVAGILQAIAAQTKAPVVVFGSKQFGYNVNPFGRVPMDQRGAALAKVPEAQIAMNEAVGAMLPDDRFVDQIRQLGPDGRSIHFFDERGNPLTPDRNHLTLYGARKLAEILNARDNTAWRAIVEARPIPKGPLRIR